MNAVVAHHQNKTFTYLILNVTRKAFLKITNNGCIDVLEGSIRLLALIHNLEYS